MPRLLLNPQARRTRYDPALAKILNSAAMEMDREALAGWPQLRPGPTPLYNLPGQARRLGLGSVRIKDESQRSSLGSFKALGAPIALARLIQRTLPETCADSAALFTGHHATQLQTFTAISATDGNHGRALAAAARSIGCACVIVLHAHVSQEREDAIAAHGARIVRIAGNYDDSVRHAQALASEHGWHVVSDTSYDGYEDIPRDVMQGYGIIAAEALEQAGADPDACPYTHVILQGGVGGLAAGMIAELWERYGDRRPHFLIVEPEQADCLFQSARQGHAASASGSVDSIMAGLACGETSPLAWRFLAPCSDLFMTLEDDAAVMAMRSLAQGQDGDIPVLSGESGAAGLAALYTLATQTSGYAQAGLDADAHVLLINSEGATAPGLYAELTGESPEDVIARQQTWRSEL